MADLRRVVLAQMNSGGIRQGVAGALVEALDGINEDLTKGRPAASAVNDLGDLITQQITEGAISGPAGQALDGPYAALSAAVR